MCDIDGNDDNIRLIGDNMSALASKLANATGPAVFIQL